MRKPYIGPNGVYVPIYATPDPVRYAPRALRAAVLARDGFCCRYCGGAVTNETANIDHVLPWRHGGPTVMGNLVTSCRRCNKAKGNKRNASPRRLDAKPAMEKKARHGGKRTINPNDPALVAVLQMHAAALAARRKARGDN